MNDHVIHLKLDTQHAERKLRIIAAKLTELADALAGQPDDDHDALIAKYGYDPSTEVHPGIIAKAEAEKAARSLGVIHPT